MTTTTGTTIGTAADAENDWLTWRDERNASVSAPFGLSAVTGTHWLSGTPTEVPGLPGLWTAEDVEQFDSNTTIDGQQVAVLRRDGQIALRVFGGEPTATGVEAFGHDPAWRFEAEAVAATADVTTTHHVDGRVGPSSLAGEIRLVVAGHDLALEALAVPDGRWHVVFADTTNGVTTQQFRFLLIDAPDTDGHVVVDFNRAFLPPCAFAPHYLCPLPPASNRLPFEVTAGETYVQR